MAGVSFKGLKAYQQDMLVSEQASLTEPNQLIDELIDASRRQNRPVQDKSTLKHLVATDIKHQMPPQMYAIVASLAKLIDAVEVMNEEEKRHE